MMAGKACLPTQPRRQGQIVVDVDEQRVATRLDPCVIWGKVGQGRGTEAGAAAYHRRGRRLYGIAYCALCSAQRCCSLLIALLAHEVSAHAFMHNPELTRLHSAVHFHAHSDAKACIA